MEEVQRDPRAMSDITDDEEAQLDPRKYADAESEKFLDEPAFELGLSQRRDEGIHHENKYCELECGHTCNYKAASQSYLDNLIWRESEVNHYYEPKLIIDLSNWKEQQSKERADRKSKSKCEKNGLVKAQLDKEKHHQHQQGFDFDSFIAGTIRLSLQPESRDIGLLNELNELNSSVSQLSKSASQEKDEKCQVMNTHLLMCTFSCFSCFFLLLSLSSFFLYFLHFFALQFFFLILFCFSPKCMLIIILFCFVCLPLCTPLHPPFYDVFD